MKEQSIHIEIHPNWYHSIPTMKVLILGSFPPHQNKHDYSFYYPNKQNNFWKILATIHKTDLIYFKGDEAVHERKRLMEQMQVGVQNLGKKIERIGLSARDTDIAIVEFQNILSIIRKHKELKRILISGYSAENSTFKAFITYLVLNTIKHTLPEKVKPGYSFSVFINDRTIVCTITNSTSTAARIKFETLVEQFKKVIL